jgi:hypothetical protein
VLKRVTKALLCVLLFSAASLAATPAEEVSEEVCDMGFEMMLQIRMHALGIEPAPVTHERLCIALEKIRDEQETITAQHAEAEEAFIAGAEKLRALERAQHLHKRQPEGTVSGSELHLVIAQQQEHEKKLQELTDHKMVLTQHEEEVLQQCTAAERNVGLLIACTEETADADVVAELLAAGADPNCCDEEGYTAMLRALEGGDLVAFYQLREAGGLYLATENAEMQEELNEEVAIACDDGAVPAGQLLFPIYMGGRLPADALPRALHAATNPEDAAQRVAILCHEDINVHAFDVHGQTALHYAVMRYQITSDAAEREVYAGIIEGLLEAGADVRVANTNGKTVYDDYASQKTRALFDKLMSSRA